MSASCDQRIREAPVEIPMWEHRLHGLWAEPRGEARASIVVANTIEGGRSSSRNRYLCHAFQAAGLSTLLVNLLEEPEARDRDKVFNIGMLSMRLDAATRWLIQQADHRGVPIGYYGSSTGAAAAMVAAARHSREVGAVVVRGGRLDLAWDYLPEVAAPTLLIVSGHDEIVLDRNEWALDRLRCVKEMVIGPDARRFLPESTALEATARLALDWFQRHLHAAPGDVHIAAAEPSGWSDRFTTSDMDLKR